MCMSFMVGEENPLKWQCDQFLFYIKGLQIDGAVCVVPQILLRERSEIIPNLI